MAQQLQTTLMHAEQGVRERRRPCSAHQLTCNSQQRRVCWAGLCWARAVAPAAPTWAANGARRPTQWWARVRLGELISHADATPGDDKRPDDTRGPSVSWRPPHAQQSRPANPWCAGWSGGAAGGAAGSGELGAGACRRVGGALSRCKLRQMDAAHCKQQGCKLLHPIAAAACHLHPRACPPRPPCPAWLRRAASQRRRRPTCSRC